MKYFDLGDSAEKRPDRFKSRANIRLSQKNPSKVTLKFHIKKETVSTDDVFIFYAY